LPYPDYIRLNLLLKEYLFIIFSQREYTFIGIAGKIGLQDLCAGLLIIKLSI